MAGRVAAPADAMAAPGGFLGGMLGRGRTASVEEDVKTLRNR